MGDADSAVRFVYVLAACPLGPIGVDAEVLGINVDIHFFCFRQYCDRRCRCVDPALALSLRYTLNAMHPDLLVVRHPHSGAVNLLAEKVNCAVLNAGDGRHEHPTQALLDALTIRRRKGRLHRLNIAICGDIAHSRVARSNILLLGKMENRVKLIGPPTLMPAGVADWGVEVYDDMARGLEGADVVMMLRLQRERMDGGFIPSEREYYHRYGLDAEKLACAKEDAIVMHPGPMNRGVEIDGTIADDINRSVIQEQVEMGVAVRMAAMDLLAQNLAAERAAYA